MTDASQPAQAPARRWVLLGWQRTDQYWPVTLLGVGAVLAAAVLAIMGLPPADLHSPLHRLGIMDPLCGGTRAARYAAMGQWSAGWRYNPLGVIVVLAGAAVAARAVVGLITRRWITVAISWTPRRRAACIVILTLLVVTLEVRQQLRADLLMATT